MLSLRSLILNDLQCFDLNLNSDDDYHEEDLFVEPKHNDANSDIELTITQTDVEFSQPELSLEEPEVALEEPSLEEGSSEQEPVQEEPVQEEPVQEEPVQEEKKQKKYTKKKEVNLTEQWVFHPAYNRYENIVKEMSKNLKASTYFKIPEDDQLDRVLDFMVSMIETDHLRPELEKENTIKVGAVWHHFTQWLVRFSHKQGKDVLSREKEGSRTQSQLVKRSLGLEEVFEPPVVARQVKNEDGDVLDLYDEYQSEDFDFSIREKTLNEKVLACLKIKFPDEYEFYNQLYLDKFYQKYPSVSAWSKAIDMPASKLRQHLDRMTKKLQSFGRDLFLS